MGHERRHADHPPACPGLDQKRLGRGREFEESRSHGGEAGIPGGAVDLADRPAVGEARIAHHDIETAETLDGLGHEAQGGARLGKIAFQDQRLAHRPRGRSAATFSAPPRFLRACKASAQPDAANARAVAAPIPDEAPVIRKTREGGRVIGQMMAEFKACSKRFDRPEANQRGLPERKASSRDRDKRHIRCKSLRQNCFICLSIGYAATISRLLTRKQPGGFVCDRLWRQYSLPLLQVRRWPRTRFPKLGVGLPNAKSTG